jgi:hypothetical protein
MQYSSGCKDGDEWSRKQRWAEPSICRCQDRSGARRTRIRRPPTLRILDQTATRPTLSQPAAQSILQNELVAARTYSSSDGIWITNNRAQPRVLDLSASATTRRTFCADAAVCNSHHPTTTTALDQSLLLGSEMLTDDPPTGSRSLHVQKHTCSNCGYPSASIRKCTSLRSYTSSSTSDQHTSDTAIAAYEQPTDILQTPRTRTTTHPPLIHENIHLT